MGSIQLPSTYTADPAKATFEHGELRLVFPKAEEAKPRRIQLGGTGQQAMTSAQGQPQPAGQGATS